MANSWGCIVVGSGPAGLMAACRAASAGSKVLVLEALNRPGLKLLASGAGKCNLTNILADEELARRYGEAWRFLLPSLRAFPPEALREWFAVRGVPTVVTDGFHVFPRSQRAADVLEVLQGELRKDRGIVRTEAPVTHLVRGEDGLTGGVQLRNGEVIFAKRVILACGGLGYPALGAKGIGYDLARQAGHSVTDLAPALVGLRTLEKWPGACAGIVLPDCVVKLDKNREGRGEVLFSHHGISGPAVLDISGAVAAQLAQKSPVSVQVNFFPERSVTAWREQFALWQREQGRKHVRNLLGMLMPQAVVDALIVAAALPDGTTAAQLSGRWRDALIEMLGSCPLTICDTEGWPKAMACRGGVHLKEIDSRTMRSRLDGNLAFAGEFVDVVGPCGGYNLQWAFSSGWVAGSER